MKRTISQGAVALTGFLLMAMLQVMHASAADFSQSDFAKNTTGATVTPDVAPDAVGQTRIHIEHFRVEGNTLLGDAEIQILLAPYTGNDKGFADLQRAQETLEAAYKRAGYSTVVVAMPEQEVESGVVRFQVIEARIKGVEIAGNKYYDTENIRLSLPGLKEGAPPNARVLAENLALANENPSKKLDVVLSMTDVESEVNAKVKVKDSPPQKWLLSLDNSGTPTTGMWRTGLGYQYNNLANRDYAATLMYVTSPDHPRQVRQFSTTMRLPLYALGDSIDLLAAYSNTDAGTTMTVAGPLSFSGRGTIYGVHYNHNLERVGTYSAKFVTGIEHRAFYAGCSLGNFGAAGCGSAAAPITIHPFSLGYEGQYTGTSSLLTAAGSFLVNIPGGKNGTAADFIAARPSAADPTIGASPTFKLLKLDASASGALYRNWQYRVAASGQYTTQALIAGESFGLVGSNAVRGFMERELSGDKGYFTNLELYTPELAGALGVKEGSIRLLGFLDSGQAYKIPLAGETPITTTVMSAGCGVRTAYTSSLVTKFDVAKVVTSSSGLRKNSARVTFNAMLVW